MLRLTNLCWRPDSWRRPWRPPQDAGDGCRRGPPPGAGHCAGQAEGWSLCRSRPARPSLTTAAPNRWRVLSRGAVMPGTLVITDDWSGYASLRASGATTTSRIAECGDPEVAEEFLPICPSRLQESEDVAERHPPRRQRQASASLPQRVHFPVQPPLLPVQRLPLSARCRGWRRVHQPLQNSIRAIGCILHVVGMGVNRIGTIKERRPTALMSRTRSIQFIGICGFNTRMFTTTSRKLSR